MKARLAVDALTHAVRMRGEVAGCIVDSDRASQFRSTKDPKALARNRLAAPMSTVASCGDNAAMETVLQSPTKERFSTGTDEQPETNCASQSSPGSSTPTTDAARTTTSHT